MADKKKAPKKAANATRFGQMKAHRDRKRAAQVRREGRS